MKDNRRYDIDWLRVIAIGFLIIYHTAIVFQPWGLMVGFMTNKENLETLWKPMMMLNIWRIPILFFISGMGVYFSFQSRDGIALIKERALRILVPFIFGGIVLVPIYMLLLQKYYDWNLQYLPSRGHLWFLGNIFLYVLLSLPFLYYLKNNCDEKFVIKIKNLFISQLGLLFMMTMMVLEAYLLRPPIYEMYAMTWHGFVLGFLAFNFGYVMAMDRRTFDLLASYKWIFLILASMLYIYRILQVRDTPQYITMPVESLLWIFAIFGLGYKYLNFSNATLNYLSSAAYPVYILHMLFIALSSWVLLPLSIPASLKFVSIVVLTFLGSFLTYEFLVKKFVALKVLFGLKIK